MKRRLETSSYIQGVAIDDSRIVLVQQSSSEIKVFDRDSLEPLESIIVNEMRNPWDIIAIEGVLYVSDKDKRCIFKISDKSEEKWSVNSKLVTLSPAERDNILACCFFPNKLVEYSPTGLMIFQIDLNARGISLSHAIQLYNGNYVICDTKMKSHRIVQLDDMGDTPMWQGPVSELDGKSMNTPRYLAKERHNIVLIADQNNDRILLHNPLTLAGETLPLKGHQIQSPYRICLDAIEKRLYVVEERQNKLLIFKFGK